MVGRGKGNCRPKKTEHAIYCECSTCTMPKIEQAVSNISIIRDCPNPDCVRCTVVPCNTCGMCGSKANTDRDEETSIPPLEEHTTTTTVVPSLNLEEPEVKTEWTVLPSIRVTLEEPKTKETARMSSGARQARRAAPYKTRRPFEAVEGEDIVCSIVWSSGTVIHFASHEDCEEIRRMLNM